MPLLFLLYIDNLCHIHILLGVYMLDYISEIMQSASLSVGDLKNNNTFTVIGAKAVVVNNYNKILTYSSDRVVLKVSSDELVIEGHDIGIRELSRTDIILSGNIAHIYYAGA